MKPKVILALFPETADFYPSIVYWSDGTLYLVHLLDEGPSTGAIVDGIAELDARILLRAENLARSVDPYDIIAAAQRLARPA